MTNDNYEGQADEYAGGGTALTCMACRVSICWLYFWSSCRASTTRAHAGGRLCSADTSLHRSACANGEGDAGEVMTPFSTKAEYQVVPDQ
jgi:hypothetical protein